MFSVTENVKNSPLEDTFFDPGFTGEVI